MLTDIFILAFIIDEYIGLTLTSERELFQRVKLDSDSSWSSSFNNYTGMTDSLISCIREVTALGDIFSVTVGPLAVT